jgi:tetratricopeptide (TPR) repeat protein
MLGRTDEALAELCEAVRLKPEWTEPHVALSEVYNELGRDEESAACLREAVKLSPGDATTHNNLGAVYYKLGRLQEAAASLEQAARLVPSLAAAHEQGLKRINDGKVCLLRRWHYGRLGRRRSRREHGAGFGAAAGSGRGAARAESAFLAGGAHPQVSRRVNPTIKGAP